ncbi:immunoglobulin lambda-like polypeptide 1 [Grus japonensis]
MGQASLWGRGRYGAGFQPVKVTSPSVFPLVACGSGPTPVVACLVGGYFPEPVTVTWDSGSVPSVSRNFPAGHLASGLYSLGSQLTVTSGNPTRLQCTVQHPPSRYSRTINVPVTVPEVPTVGFFHSCDISSVQLVCLINRFSPATVTVEWLVDGFPVYPNPPSEPVEPEASGRTFRTSSHLNVSLEEWQQKTYTCKVTHPASGTTQEVVGHKCLTSPPDANNIQVFILPPTPSELYVSQTPKVRCLATSLPSDDGLVVTWTRRQGGTLRPHLLELKAQYNGTFTATSEVPISTRDWENGETFTCTIQHNDLPSTLSRSISKRPGKRLTPSVALLPPPPEELSARRDTLSLTCLARAFYPEDISVEWQKNQDAVDAGSYDVTAPMKEKTGDASYFVYSRLGVAREAWLQGNTYVCMVVHEALPMKFIQRSVNKQPEFSLPEDLCQVDPEKSNGPWDTIAVFITLFLLSVCYSATVTLFKVKWLLSTVIQLKQSPAPDYKNVIQPVV